MDTFDVYLLFSAVDLHFRSRGFNISKYGYKSRANWNSFLKRKDKFVFTRIGSLYKNTDDIVDFLVSQYVRSNKIPWVTEFVSNDGIERYKQHIKIKDSLTNIFMNDIDTLYSVQPSFDLLLRRSDSSSLGLPQLIESCVIDNIITIETVLQFEHIFPGLLEKINKNTTDEFLWPQFLHKLYKYQYFCRKLERQKIRNIILCKYNEQN